MKTVIDTKSQNEIIEGNKLIVEFMGINPLNSPITGFARKKDYVVEPFGFFDAPDLKYHTSWNWLMPAVEKISCFEYDRHEQELPFGGTEIVIDTAYPRTFGMLSSEGKPMVRFNNCALFIEDTLIEATWLAVVDFINWYNQKQQHENI